MKKLFIPLPLKARQGSGVLVLALVLCLITATLAIFATRITHSLFTDLFAQNINNQANEYARDKIELLKATAFLSLASQPKTAISGTNYASRIGVSYGSSTRNATVDIFYGSETTPRATLSLTRTQKEETANTGCPIGTIIAWPSPTLPTTGGTWLWCNGQAIPSKYMKLALLVGGYTPSTNGLFLRCTGSALDSSWVNHSSGYLLSVRTDTTPTLTGYFHTYVPLLVMAGTHKVDKSMEYNFHLNDVAPSGAFYTDNYLRESYTNFDRNDSNHENATYKYTNSFDNSRVIRTAQETRPINVGVYFIIKAE